MTEKKLRFFKTSSRQFTETHSSIFQKLRMKLEGSRIESRIVKLHPNRDDSDEDVLSYYAILEGDYLFGMIIRISTKRSVKAIPVDYTHLDNLKFSDMPEVNDANHERYCTSHYYFILKGNYLVTDLPHNMTITRFQDFINKLLDQEEKYNYVPMLDTGQISMNEVTKIVVRDKSIEGEQIQSTGNPIMSKIKSAMNLVLKGISPQMPSLRSVQMRNIFSAELIINAKRPREMTLDDYNRQLSAVLQPISDGNNVKIYTKKGMITGDQLVLTKAIEIGSETDLLNQMKQQLNRNCFPHEN